VPGQGPEREARPHHIGHHDAHHGRVHRLHEVGRKRRDTEDPHHHPHRQRPDEGHVRHVVQHRRLHGQTFRSDGNPVESPRNPRFPKKEVRRAPLWNRKRLLHWKTSHAFAGTRSG